VSEEVEQRIKSGDLPEQLSDWRSGDRVIVVDCISPIAAADTFIERFMVSVKQAQAKADEGA